MKVSVFRGTAADVNSYMLIDDKEVFLIDALRSVPDAVNLAKYIEATGKPLGHVLITHGHPDHYMGLNVLRRHFPQARFVVGREGVKEDIIRCSLEMEKDGSLDGNPAFYPYDGDPGMKGVCPANPHGFDYDRELEVLPTNRMQTGGGIELRLTTLYQPTECAHLTVVYVPAINALFTSDLVYSKMFPWMGKGVERSHVQNWVHALEQLRQAYGALHPSLYPGHGTPGEVELLEQQIAFFDNFLSIVDRAPSEYEAVAALIREYPGYYQRDFILPCSVSNFMKGQRSADKGTHRNIYIVRSNPGEQRWNGASRKVL
jgi:glyoxylase-like metal-dependent hydrolase (beta-lactamase superfamily II)